MDNLGKCLLFYLKYSSEMERLYESDDRVAEARKLGLPNAEKVLDQVQRVGKTACREGAEFLEECAKIIENCFGPISKYQKRRKDLEKLWDLQFWIWPKTARNSRRKFLVGVTIDYPPVSTTGQVG